MAGKNARTCVERYCELANKNVDHLYKVSSPCLDDHHFKKEDFQSVGDLSNVSSQIVLKCLYLTRIGRPDILWSVNKLARTVTKWTQACGRRLARLISYTHHTNDNRQYCHVGNTVQHSQLGLFQESDLLATLRIQNQLRVKSYVSSETEHLSTSVGSVRDKRQYPTVPQSLKPSRVMLDCEWMDYMLSISGMW